MAHPDGAKSEDGPTHNGLAMPSPFYRSRAPRQSGPAFDATPLQEAYKQEAQADGATRELAIQQDVIAQQQRQDEQFAREQAAAGRAAAKANAQAHEISVKVAKSQGVETVVDPMTGKDAVKTTPDGAPVWQPGFQGGIRPGDNDRHVVDYRDTTGATYRLPVDSIRRNDGPTGPVYEFDVPGKDGKPTTIRRAEEPGKPLFKIDPETGMRYAEAQDQTTGGLIQQPIGMDPQAANKAAIKNIGAEWDRQKAERTFKADELRLQQQVIETENAPVREKLAETERKLKTFDTTGAHYIQEPDGTILQKRSASDTGMPVNDNPQELLKAQSWLAEKKRLEGDLARLTAEQEPVTKKLQEMQVQRDKMALSILQDGRKTKLRQLAMEKAAAKGAELWKPATQQRIEQLIESPGFSLLQLEAENEGQPMAEDIARATRNPALESISNALGGDGAPLPDANQIGNDLDGSALGDTRQRVQLDSILATAPKTAKLPDGKPDVMASSKSLGIDKPAEFDLEGDGQGLPKLFHRPSGRRMGLVDAKNNRLIIDPDAAYHTEEGRAMVKAAGNDTVPLFVLAGGVPFTPRERADYFANAVAAAQANDSEGMASVGADLAGIRRNVQEGRLSVQDAKWLSKTIHGYDQPDLSDDAVNAQFSRYIQGSKVESAMWTGEKATPESRAEVVNRFMDGLSQKSRTAIFYNAPRLDELRERLMGENASKGMSAKVGDWLADTSKMLLGSISGLAANLTLDAGEIAVVAGSLGGYKTSERFNLTTENTAEWLKKVANFMDRDAADTAMQSALTDIRNWAGSADPEDAPPPELMDKLAGVAFYSFHQLSDDAEAKARATTKETFDLTKDPVLAKHFSRYLETRNPAHWEAIKQLIKLDNASRALADRIREYITRPRAATPQDVMDRASSVFPGIRPEQAKALLDAASNKDGSTKAAKILGVSPEDGALALDLFTGKAATSETSLNGYFRSGMQAPLQEAALEAASIALSAGFGKIAARGFVQAAKGVTVQASRRAAAASWVATQAATLVDDFTRLGMFRAKLGQPLTRLQKASNAAVTAVKAVSGDMAGEAVEEGAMEVGQAGSTLGSVFAAAGQGAIAAPLMVGGMTVLALPVEIRNERRMARDWEAAKSAYLATINERLAEIPGTQPLAPEEFETALALYGNAAARLDAETIGQAAAVLESGPPSPQAQEGLMQAVVQAKAREALAVNATLEMRDLTEEQRTLYTAVAKAALGVPEFTLAESQALNRLGGDLAVRFTAAPGATQVDAYSATDLPGGRQAMAQGAVPIVPPALMAQVAQAAPSLGELMGMAPAPQVSPVSNGANSPTPTPAATGSKTTSGASGNAPATPAKGGVGKAQGAPKATPANGAPVITPFKAVPNAKITTLPDGRVEVKWTGKGDAAGVVMEAKDRGFGVSSRKTISQGEANETTILLRPLASESTKPSGQQGPTAEKPETVDSIARRVISTITSRSPKLKKLVSESKAAPDYATGGMWLNSDGTVSYHLPTLRKQLTGLDPHQIGRRIEALIDEEIRHAAHWKAAERLHKQAMATPGNLQVDFETWRDAWYGNIWENEFTDAMRARVREAYGDTMDAMPDWMKAMEGLRMLDQLRATGSITEAVLKHLEAVLAVLKEMLDQATPAVRREIDAIQAVLVEFGYENGQVKPDAAKKPAKPQSKPKAESSAGVSDASATSPPPASQETASQPEAKPAEPSREEWQKTFAKFKRDLAKAVKAKDYPEIIRQADAFQKHYEAEGSGPFPDSWSDWERHKAEAEMQLASQGKTENPLTVPILKPLTTPRPAERTDDAYAKAQEATRAALGGLFSAPAYRTIPQLEVSSERFDAVRKAAVAILAANIRTPEAFARFMDDTFPGGKARPYSEAIWDLIGVADKSLRGTHDWTTIYGKIDTPLPEVVEDEPSTEEKPQLTAKQQDEAKELEITKQAREIVMRGDTPQQTFRALVELYKNQPKLTAKTSTSKINQAYSTPAPMAFMASRLADVIGGRVIAEPSAGNGMLLIERHSGQTVLANEIDPERRQRLAEQGIMSTGQDATTWTPEQTPDRVIANPPFGQVMEQGGGNKVFQTPMGETTSIDHAILLQSLATMAPDGRAVFIIGGPPPTVRTEEGRMAYYRGGKAGKFFGHLYGNHRVIDHFTINGDLYEKQGAGWPLDVIVVQGPGRSSNTLPGMKAPRMLESWEDIARELDRTDAERIQLNQLTEGELRKRTGAVAGELAGLSGGLRGAAGGRSGNAGAQPSGVRGGEADAGFAGSDRTGIPGDAGQRTIEPSTAGVRGGQAPGVGSGDVRSTSQEQPAADNAGVGQLRAGEVSSSEYQAAFPATSGVNPAGLLAPVNLIGPMREAMDRLKDAVGGDLVSYVRKKLGYPEGTDIAKFYFGDQIDALAQAIHTAETGGALVIGDQTGTGKGRIAAGLMKYAVHNGLVPVFVTKDQTLYDAMLDDLKDVDAGEIVPALTNTDIKEKTLKAKLADLGAERGKEVFQEIADTGELPQGTNTIFTSYDQIKADDAPGITPRDRARAKQDMEAPPGGWRMAALRAVSPRALFILDESHLAGGQSTTGWRFGELLRRAKHAYYSSATFAKRPDNMGIYFRTNLGKVGGDINGIIGLMQAGGVPAMQIGSSMLAKDGQYMRRERSFEGVTFRTHINSNTYERDRALADNYTEGLRAIIEVQERMVRAAGIVNRILASFGKRANIPVSNRPRLESANFSAKLHNLVRQYLLAIKAQSAAQLAAQAIRDGVQASDGTVKRHKVIVTVENTMESVIDELETSGLPLNFNGVLQMYLNQMRRIKVGGGGYGREAKYFEVSETPNPKFEDLDDDALSERLVVTAPNPETGEPSYVVNEDVSAELVRRSMIGAFNEARDLINDINLADMPLSPIDAMRQAVEASGIRTGEMTGRSTGIDKNGQIYRRSASEIRGKLQAKDAFNNDDLDFLVINKTGSTGVSMHASEKFADKRPRLMMVVQANLDINEFMQTIGRIHRAGQVELPSYINLQTALPAENRPAAILGRKMAMLNANTTSNADSELSQQDAVDIFNKYGDEVVHDYLRKNPGLVRLVAQSWEKLVDQEMNLRPLGDFQDEAEGGGDSYLSRSVTGHLAILPVDEQEAFWESVTSEYRAKIAYLDEIGKNDLRASVLDLKAETVESKVFTPGSDTGSAFERPSYIELVNAEMGRRPLSADDAVQAANDARQKAAGRQDAFIESANAFIDAEDARKATVQRNWQDKRDDWRSNQQEQRDTIANAIGLIGNFGNMEREDGSQGYAFVEDVQINAEKPNTPSAHFAIIRVNDSRDRLKVPLSQFGDFKPVAASEFNRDRMGRDGWQRSWSFGTQQAVITGNLLSALGELQARQARARVISYTKRDGSQQMGILLGQKAAEEIRSQEQTQAAVETSEDMAALVNAGFTVKNTSGNVRFAAMDGSYFLYVPLARSTGGKFWRDPGLLEITGEFEKSGSDTFVATMSREEATRAFDYLKSVQGERFVKPVIGGGPASSPAPDAGKQAAMKEALKAMPPIWRTVLEASMKGTPPEQIAADNGLSIVAVGNVLRVAQGRLRFLLDAKAGKLKPLVRVEDEKIKASSGRPDLAMSANPAFVVVDQRRASPEEVTHGEMNELAVRLFDVDADAAERLVVRWMDSGTTVLSTDGFPDGIRQIVQEAQSRSAAEMLMTAAAKMLVTQKATAGGDPIQVARLIDLYRNTGTEQARALNMRQDPHQTPEERAAMFIAEALLTPPESMRNEIRRNPANKERILSRWAIESQKVKDALKAEGFDIDATFAALRREQAAAARTVPQEVRFPLARAGGRVQRLVKSVLEGKTWREAAEAAKMTLEEARKAYNEFRATVNQTGQQAAQAARDALLSSAPANDFAAQIGLPEWTEDASPDVAPVKTEATEALKKERTRKKTTGEIDLKNPVATARAVQRMGPFKATAFDKISEFWRASILSGPQTHVVNLASGVSFGLYDLTLKKAGTAVLADIGRMFGMRSDAASIADVPAVAAAAIPAVKQALKDAVRAWKANDSFFSHYALDTEKKGGLWAPAIKGRKGDVIRTPFRLMLMADEFVKSAYTRIEVAAQAQQIARSEGKKGQELTNRIQELLKPGSLAWARALDKALEITFQTELKANNRAIDAIDGIADMIQSAKKGKAGGLVKGVSHFLFPFVLTPTNIFKAGVTMSPLGLGLAIADAVRAYNMKKTGNVEEANRLYNAGRFLDDMVNQIVAWGVGMIAWELVMPGEDEDALPFLTGTLPWKSTSKGEREIAYRTAPPMSIRIGDAWYSYARLDPFASALSFTVDAVKAMKKDVPMDEAWMEIGSSMLTAMQDKTFLQGFSDFLNAIDDPKRFGTRWATNIATGFIPNLIRQPIRAADENIRENDLPNDMGFVEGLATRVLHSTVPQTAVPAIDVWGRPETKGAGSGSPQTDFLLRLFSPVQPRDITGVDPLDVALLRYNYKAEKPFGVTAPTRELVREVGGKQQKASLSDADWEAFMAKSGRAARLAIGSRFNGRDLTENDVETIKDIISRAQSSFRDIEKRKAFARPPVTGAQP